MFPALIMYGNQSGHARYSNDSESPSVSIDPNPNPTEFNPPSGQRQRSSTTLDTSIPLTIIRLLPRSNSSIDYPTGFQADCSRRLSFPNRAVIFRPLRSARPPVSATRWRRSSSAQPGNHPSVDARCRSLELTNPGSNPRKVLALDSALQELCIRPARSAAVQERKTWNQDESRTSSETPAVKLDLRKSTENAASAKMKLNGRRRRSADLESGKKSDPLKGVVEEMTAAESEKSSRKSLEIYMPKINF